MRKGIMQKSNIIKEKTYQFALAIINLYRTMQKQNEFVLSKQSNQLNAKRLLA